MSKRTKFKFSNRSETDLKNKFFADHVMSEKAVIEKEDWLDTQDKGEIVNVAGKQTLT